MKIFQILNNHVHYEMTGLYATLEEAKSHYDSSIIIVEAPNNVFEGWGYDGSKSGDARFIKPSVPEGMYYDEENGCVVNLIFERESERISRHASTTNDTMQALRKIREGDTSIDWESWLKALDDYNLAIEDTKNQKDYPLKVIYPEYPKKPTK